MKFVQFTLPQDDEVRPGLREGDCIVDLKEIDSHDDAGFAGILRRATSKGFETIAKEVRQTSATEYDEDGVKIHPPVAPEARIICLGGVYPSHLQESGNDLNKVPAQWLIPDTAIIGPNDPIVLTERVIENVEPAVELGVVLGRSGSSIPQTKVYDHIAGYTVVNDVTARTEWPGPRSHKIMDTFCPCGPHIVSENEIDCPTNLTMEIKQAGKEICRGHTSGIRFTLPFLVSFLSEIMPLRSGDVIATGDPGGVSETLQPGTTTKSNIERIGQLTNPVVQE